MVTFGNLVVKHYHQFNEKYFDKLHLQLENLIPTGSTEKSNLQISYLGPMGIAVLEDDNILSSLNQWSLERICNFYIDIEIWQEEALPAVIKKNTVSEITVLKQILREYDLKSTEPVKCEDMN